VRSLFALAALVVVALTLVGCGSSRRAVLPAPASTRSAVVRLMQARIGGSHLAKGATLHVWWVRIAASDPHFAEAYVGLTGGPYGGGKGDTAFAFAMELGGRWSLILGPGTGFPEECHRPTVKAVAALVHSQC
jgi:hypothetical protein